MHWHTLSLSASLWLGLSHVSAAELPVANANHIFNAINSAMRQWGSSLNHNGMTAFIASVPQDTQFYHGTSKNQRINGTEWLAFEPEHALLFARPRRTPPPDRDGRKERHRPPPSLAASPEHQRPLKLRSAGPSFSSFRDKETQSGYLHTYRTKHPLRLLYVDGQSAAKSTKGTLDLQDIVILRNELDNAPPSSGRGNGPMQEHERAELLCQKAARDWRGRIDGVLRMEGGFEIILCSFEQHLDLVSINAVQHESEPDHVKSQAYDTQLDYYKAIATRYDGIGDHRVALDLHRFATLFADDSSLIFDSLGFPRAQQDDDALRTIRQQIDDMVLGESQVDAVDWQSKTDMVVSRYADHISNLASAKHRDLNDLRNEIDLVLQPFIDHDHRDGASEVERCAHQVFSDASTDTGLAHSVILNVTTTICSALSTAAASTDVRTITTRMKDLRDWLAWTTWRRCKGCSADQVCFLPIWPAGTLQDFQRPSCKSSFDWQPDHDTYWHDDL